MLALQAQHLSRLQSCSASAFRPLHGLRRVSTCHHRHGTCSSSTTTRQASTTATRARVSTSSTSRTPSQPLAADLPDVARINIKDVHWNLGSLVQEVKSGQIEVRPPYQRGAVWSLEMASKLVVTCLENRFVPPLVLESTTLVSEPAKSGDSTMSSSGKATPKAKVWYTVLDGKQRLASLVTFVLGGSDVCGLGEWKGAPVKLKINANSNCDMSWDGYSFKTLPKERQELLERYMVRAIVIETTEKTDREAIFKIYEDIHAAYVAHTMQQSRRAVYFGPYIQMLDDLAQDVNFKQIFRGVPSQPGEKHQLDVEREQDRELILRFFAMKRSVCGRTYTGPMYKFLNKEIKEYRHLEEADVKKMTEMFKATAETVWTIWGVDGGGCRALGSSALNSWLWDTVMVSVCEELYPRHDGGKYDKDRRRELVEAGGKLRQAYEDLLKEPAFKAIISITSTRSVMERFRMFKKDVLAKVEQGPRPPKRRGFTKKEKKQKWQEIEATNGGEVQCAVCNNPITSFDEAHGDHKIPHSQFGPTEYDNLQLTHKWCNQVKSDHMPTLPEDSSSTAAPVSTRRRRRATTRK